MSALLTFRPLRKFRFQRTTATKKVFDVLRRWYINYRTRRQLASLPDEMLKDIGISRVDAEQEATKVFWKD